MLNKSYSYFYAKLLHTSLALLLTAATSMALAQDDPANSSTDTPVITEVESPTLDAGATPAESTEQTTPEATTPDLPQTGSVSRAIFTTNVVDHEPVDDITTANKDIGKIYFFTELNNMEGQMITHRWEYNSEVMAEVNFEVGSPRWRVYSVKNILPEWIGHWTVVVSNADGHVLQSSSLDVTE